MKCVPLGQIAKIKMGTAPPGSSYNENCLGTPLIAGASDYGETYPKPKRWTTEPTVLSKPGDLIICVRATIGDLNWADKAYCLGRGVAGLEPDKKFLDENYLAHYLKKAKGELFRFATGSTFPAIRRADLEEFPIPLPPLEEQKRIAAILDKADALRRKRHQAIELTETFLRSVFLDMFGDPVTNPKGWEVARLESLLRRKFQNGAYYPKEQYTESVDGVEMVHMSDAFYNTVVFDKIKRVQTTAADIAKYGLDENDVLVARRSLNYEGSAKPCRIPEIARPLIFESSLIRVSPDVEKLNPLYFFYYLSNPRVRSRYLFKNVTRSTISGINQSGLSRVKIVLPPIELQNRFERLHRKCDSALTTYRDSLCSLDSLFSSLTSSLFEGKSSLGNEFNSFGEDGGEHVLQL